MFRFFRELLRKEAARVVAFTGSAATAAVLALASQLGVELSTEFVAGVGVFAVILTEEAIRHLVFSRDTVEQIIENERQDAP